MDEKIYSYVGPPEIKAAVRREAHCMRITSPDDLGRWIASFKAENRKWSGEIPATYVIDTSGQLWMADRRSEHVACADGQDVLAAGEIFIEEAPDITVSDVTNLSTGYCPGPECWNPVERALQRLGIPHPEGFTTAFEFRKCPACGATNVIKDGWYYCSACDKALPEDASS